MTINTVLATVATSLMVCKLMYLMEDSKIILLNPVYDKQHPIWISSPSCIYTHTIGVNLGFTLCEEYPWQPMFLTANYPSVYANWC